MPLTREQNRANVAAFRARQRARRARVNDLSAFMLESEVFEDIRLDVEPTSDGTLRVNYVVPDHTAGVLSDYCDRREFDLDDILGDAIEEAIARCTRRREQIATVELATAQ